ncbi:MAG: flagellar basal-body rod protein FlgC [Osedax symbiont Rs2]|nr:MAG: flagellar basal-body rod protein FlgC [Osedax symbiont Rs2]
MSLANIFSISGSAMSAQSIRLNTTASNMANAQSISSSVDETSRARKPVFALQEPSEHQLKAQELGLLPGQGVKVMGIVESNAPLQPEYLPSHPLADENGYIYYPNVNVVEEMADMISASRAFQINADVMDSAKKMMQRVISLGQ